MTTTSSTTFSTLLDRATRSSVGARPLAVTRIMIAVAALLKIFLLLPALVSLSDEPLPLPRLPLPDIPWEIVVSVWILAAILLLVGFALPLTTGLLASCCWYTLFLDERSYSNHLLLLSILVTILTFSGGGRLRRGRVNVPGAAVFLVLTQVSTMYAFAALAKINPSFLAGEVLYQSVGSDTALVSFSIDGTPQPVITAGAVLVIATELGIAVALWVPQLRLYAMAGGILMHLSIALTMQNPLALATFGLVSTAVYPLFASWHPGPSGRPREEQDLPAVG